jgi:deazaflavin-dependent oxidoreductase (nitroreductase family)
VNKPRGLNDPAARADGTIGPGGTCHTDGSLIVTAGRVPPTPAVEVIAVSAPVMPRPGSHPRKPLLGLRRKPGRLALAVFRMPLRAYRHDAGWLLGRTFVEFTHTGRKTGRRYETVAMVLRYDADAREAVICAAWGPDTDWVRNLRAGPAARVRLGRESFTPQHRFLSEGEAFDVAAWFRTRAPAAAAPAQHDPRLGGPP